ncbi:MAG: ATP-binding protein [Chitinophagaceae bacterium]|nr:MAG: ATP-binding protein [Chitinophagaceae bacterium]
MSKVEIGKVLESSPSLIVIEIKDEKIYQDEKRNLQIGKYVEISDGNFNSVVAVILNIKSIYNEISTGLRFTLSTQPIGYIQDESFIRGASIIPSPTEPVFVIQESTLRLIFHSTKDYSFPFGKLVQNKETNVFIDPDKLFSKHIALVGSTGSGKSCAVAKILQDVVGITEARNLNKGKQKNAHVIIFDIHSEYESAFKLEADEQFTLNVLDVESLKLPYWLMNSEELESIFIESNEANSHNQVSQFKRAVILNKELHNPNAEKVNYDTPVYFDIEQVCRFIKNHNISTKDADTGELKIDISCTKLKEQFAGIPLTQEMELFGEIKFAEKKTGKVNAGHYNGEFNRFCSRLDAKLQDKRLEFLLNPRKADGTKYVSDDFEKILMQFIGYIDKANVSIIDLSGIPFEVLSITVSLISRLVFDFAFHYSKIKHASGESNDIPFMIVCEEAHNYVPRHGGSEYSSSKKSIERIAKEGRKYGLSLMVVSQRPSEVSETIFSQCNNFISLRLTNTNDQNYIKALMPENSNSIADALPNLGQGECLIVGDASVIPSIVKLDLPHPQPKSQSIRFQEQWQKDWHHADFGKVISRWKRKKADEGNSI